MPIYDYHCETCGLDFELEQSFSEDTLSRCPTKKSGRSPAGCARSGRGKVVKVFSAPGITFKGSGFYKTDSRSTSSATSTSKDSSSKDSSSKDSSSKDSSSNGSGSSGDGSSKKSESSTGSGETSSKSSSSSS